MASINFEYAIKKAEKDPEFRKFFTALGGDFKIESLNNSDVSKIRPFLSPLSWALYSTYQAILHFAVLKLYMLQSGINAEKVLRPEVIKKLVTLALPNRTKENIEQYNASETEELINELESILPIELEKILQGVQADEDSIKSAKQIMKAVAQFNKEKSTISDDIEKQTEK